MPQARDIIQAIERAAPLCLQEEYDNAGLQCGDLEQEVGGVMFCLDVTEQVIDEAIDAGCTMIVSHHPLLFRPVRCVGPQAGAVARCLYRAIRSGLCIYSAHTNLDNAADGVNWRLAAMMGLTDVEPLVSLPAGRTAGLTAERAALCGSGCIGRLAQPLMREQMVEMTARALGTQTLRINADCVPGVISTVAVCGGAGADFIGLAQQRGAQAYVTGEVGYHRMQGHPGLLLIEAGHYETERHVPALLRDIVGQAFGLSVQTHVSTAPAPVPALVIGTTTNESSTQPYTTQHNG